MKTRLVTTPEVIYRNNEPVAAYIDLASDPKGVDVAALRWAVTVAKCANERSASGMQIKRVSFGWTPACPFKNIHRPMPAGLHRQNAEANAILDAQADKLALIYRDIAPTIYRDHLARARARLHGHHCGSPSVSPWSGGVINESLMGEHRDKNLEGWSAMVVFRHGLHGGELAVPELGITFACADSSLVLFDGNWLHGVTATYGPGWRRSCVFYTRPRGWAG